MLFANASLERLGDNLAVELIHLDGNLVRGCVELYIEVSAW